jgi:prevent-host-death family protein
MEGNMRAWKAHDAKAQFSELLNACLKDGPQSVIRNGVETAVLVPIEEWRRLRQAARPSLKELLLADVPRIELALPPRGQRRGRAPLGFN